MTRPKKLFFKNLNSSDGLIMPKRIKQAKTKFKNPLLNQKLKEEKKSILKQWNKLEDILFFVRKL